MKKIIKVDLYENLLPIIVYFIFSILLSLSLKFLNPNTSIRSNLFGLISGLSIVIFATVCLNNIINNSYKDLLKYPISRSDIANYKFVEFIGFVIIFTFIGIITYYLSEGHVEILKIIAIYLLGASYFSLTLPLMFLFSDKNIAYVFLIIFVLGTIGGFILAFISKNIIKMVLNNEIILIVLALLVYFISYLATRFILSKKEF
ncbi:ABC-2 transporter permease [Anaerococcus sp. AGMB00486]|uniref:ABC-2 transporter permease n=2 Tax=Anaerococcus TaxID=165779 RepID=A0ABX2NBF8_9FIRM|nr:MULTISPECIES: ABC-2 transporter permease [Anaerococcus]MDY3005621.1 ABC-2 transporter permease [Anaerococcus porci]MSS78165.1 hypothetical protein [Anaerococcus porci]NVF12031.1 ABC-2 transporter permease [Anaerococcus faecalis]